MANRNMTFVSFGLHANFVAINVNYRTIPLTDCYYRGYRREGEEKEFEYIP